MKSKSALVTALLCIAATGWLVHLYAQSENAPPAITEYATIRWAGKDNTHIIRRREVEFIGPQLRLLRRPEKVDERSFHMNAALNGLIKEGFELAAFTPDEIVVKKR